MALIAYKIVVLVFSFEIDINILIVPLSVGQVRESGSYSHQIPIQDSV